MDNVKPYHEQTDFMFNDVPKEVQEILNKGLANLTPTAAKIYADWWNSKLEQYANREN